MKTAEFALSVREDFPILRQRVHGRPLIYLDSAATSQKPQVVIDAISHFYAREYATVHRSVHHLSSLATERYSAARAQCARFIGARHPHEIVFTGGTTDSINLVAANFRGKEVILSEMEHHSNIVSWQLHGAKCRYIPVNERAELDLDAFQELLTTQTALVSISHIANSTGTLNPIQEIIDLAHAKGVLVLIDAAQSAAHLPLDVTALDCDFIALSSHKMFGPTGLGILYGKEHLLEQLAPISGGGDMIDRVTLQESVYAPPPLKFEAGTPPIAQVVGLGAAMDYIHTLGFDRIRAHEEVLLEYATSQLTKVAGLRIVGAARKKGPLISFLIDGIHPLDLATLLDLEGIAIRSGHQCAQPLFQRFGLSGACRVSFAPFNTLEEIDILIDAIQRVRRNL